MDFPFDIYDVAEKIGLVLKRQHNKSADYNCPFCDGIGKLNLNIRLPRKLKFLIKIDDGTNEI